MSLQFHIVETRPLDFGSLTQEQAEEVKRFLLDDILERRQCDAIAYYAAHILEDELEGCPRAVKEFLAKKIAENGGGIDITFTA